MNVTDNTEDSSENATGRDSLSSGSLQTAIQWELHGFELQVTLLLPALCGSQENKQALFIMALPIQWNSVSVQSRPFQGTSCILLYQHPNHVVKTAVVAK